jgi:hypothetical protein
MACLSSVSINKGSKVDAPECKKTVEIDRAMQEHQSIINEVGEAVNEISRRLSTVLAYPPPAVAEAAEGSAKTPYTAPKLWEVLDDQTRQLRLVRVAIVDCLDRLEL